jgi:hypothetical protein
LFVFQLEGRQQEFEVRVSELQSALNEAEGHSNEAARFMGVISEKETRISEV